METAVVDSGGARRASVSKGLLTSSVIVFKEELDLILDGEEDRPS